MAYPPTVPPANRVDATPQATNHPNDHNALSHALTDIIAELGNNPSGPKGTLQQRVTANENTLDNKLNLAGGTMTGQINMNDNPLFNLPAPTGDGEAVRKLYCDGKVKVAGDTMTGNLTIGGPVADGPGVQLYTDLGVAISTNTVDSQSVNIRRGSAADAVGQRFIRFEHGNPPGTLIGSIEIGDDTSHVKYVTSSDYRQKRRLGPITDAAERVRELAHRAYRGSWVSGTNERDFLNAHDIAEVAPYAASGTKDAVDDNGVIVPQGVDYGQLVPLLVSALGDALDRITVLEAG